MCRGRERPGYKHREPASEGHAKCTLHSGTMRSREAEGTQTDTVELFISPNRLRLPALLLKLSVHSLLIAKKTECEWKADFHQVAVLLSWNLFICSKNRMKTAYIHAGEKLAQNQIGMLQCTSNNREVVSLKKSEGCSGAGPHSGFRVRGKVPALWDSTFRWGGSTAL